MTNHVDRRFDITQWLTNTSSIFDALDEIVVVTDYQGKPLYSNPACIQTLNYTVADLKREQFPNVLFAERQVGKNMLEVLRAEGFWQQEVELTSQKGKIISFKLTIKVVEDDMQQPMGFICIGKDLSQRNKIDLLQSEHNLLVSAQLDTTKTLTRSLELEDVFERIVNNVSQVVPNDAANMILIYDDNVKLVGRTDYWGKPQVDKLKSGDATVEEYDDLRWMIQNKTYLIIPDVEAFVDSNDDMKRHTPWLKSHIGVPIHLNNEIIGFLNVDSQSAGFLTESHAEQLEIFAEQAAIAIRNARLHEQAQHLAIVEERQRLARNLHDSVSQTLFSANLIADALPELFRTKPESIPQRLTQIQKLTNGALASMRTMLLGLHPERITDTEIDVLLELVVAGTLSESRMSNSLTVSPSSLILPENLKVAIFYITQEALNNVIKHSHAQEVDITLQQQHQVLTLTISDDGKGFDPDAVSSTSFGLSNMRQRAELTEADLIIDTTIGSGTTISVSWTIGD